jgi:hypothetical protein
VTFENIHCNINSSVTWNTASSNKTQFQNIKYCQDGYIYWVMWDLTYLLTELSPSWEAVNCAAIQEIPSNFKEPEGSSPCSQQPSSGPYPEPVRSSPHHPILYPLERRIRGAPSRSGRYGEQKDVTPTANRIQTVQRLTCRYSDCANLLKRQLSFRYCKNSPPFVQPPVVHYRILKKPPLIPILSQMNPVTSSRPVSLMSILILSSNNCFKVALNSATDGIVL